MRRFFKRMNSTASYFVGAFLLLGAVALCGELVTGCSPKQESVGAVVPPGSVGSGSLAASATASGETVPQVSKSKESPKPPAPGPDGGPP